MELTAEKLREILHYDPASGHFWARVSRSPLKAGDLVGHIRSDGYRAIKIHSKAYKAHRLAWLYIHGKWPSSIIDHINGIRADNRIENLRDVSYKENSMNEWGAKYAKLPAPPVPEWKSEFNDDELTHAHLLHLLNYDSETGIFTWRNFRNYAHPKKDQVGYKGNHAYRSIKMKFGGKTKTFYCHRLAWFYMNGVWPKNEIDHINGLTDDNRLCNLREATSSQNKMNRNNPKSNKTGFVGVHKNKKRFCASINVNKKTIRLGNFGCPTAAHFAYLAAKKKYHDPLLESA